MVPSYEQVNYDAEEAVLQSSVGLHCVEEASVLISTTDETNSIQSSVIQYILLRFYLRLK